MVNLELLPNKIIAIGLIIAGLVSMLLEGDGTAMVLFAPIAIPTFFAKENWTCVQVHPREEEEKEADIIPFLYDEGYDAVRNEVEVLHGRS